MSPRISIRLLAAQSDERLVALAGQGHERAFEALVQRYRRPLLRYCRRIGLSDSRAEDVLQHALLQAWLALVRGGQVRELKPWLYRIVHNAAVSSMRRSRDDSELTDAVGASVAAARESELESKLAARDALSDVAALPQMQRDAILLSAIEGQSHKEVASALGISHGAVRGLLHRARTTLRSAAAAITPQSLIGWASRGTGGGAPTAERLAELSGAGGGVGGGVGVAGVLLKGAVVAATAGVLAAGAAVVRSPHHGAQRSKLTPPSSRALSAAAHKGSVVAPIASIEAISQAAPGAHEAVGRIRPRHAVARSTSRAALAVAPPAHGVPAGSLSGLAQRQGDGPLGAAPGGHHGDGRGGSGTSTDGAVSVDGGKSSGSGGGGGGAGAGSSGGGGSSSDESGHGQPQAGSGSDQAEPEVSAAKTETDGGHPAGDASGVVTGSEVTYKGDARKS
jgi:RNA polymerase sigma factor (sigma-70 family)